MVRMGPPFISHGFGLFIRGPITPFRGQKRSPWLLTTYKSWDDPPSMPFVHFNKLKSWPPEFVDGKKSTFDKETSVT